MGGSSSHQPKEAIKMNTKTYLVPTQLKPNDHIVVKGKITDGLFSVALLADTSGSGDVVCHVHVEYAAGNSDKPIQIKSVKNGSVQNHGTGKPASDYLGDETFFIRFKLEAVEISLELTNSLVESIQLQHAIEDIKAISVTGQVEHIMFEFNKV